MGGKSLLNSHPKKVLGSKGARLCRVCGKSWFETIIILSDNNYLMQILNIYI